MKIVVLDHPRIIAPARAEDVVNAPLSSCMFSGYVAAALQSAGHDVRLVDANLHGWTCDETVSHVVSIRPDMLAVNLVYMWDETAKALDMLSRIKGDLPPCHVTLFGYYPTFGFDFLLRHWPSIDSVILGEPEMTARELPQTLAARSNTAGLQGLALRTDGRVTRNARRPLIEDLDALPFPVRTERSLREGRGVSLYILGSRGCYNECAFCYLNAFYGAGPCWRGRSPENIIAELRLMQAHEGLSYFYFADANFFGPGKAGQHRAGRLAQLLKAEFPGVAFGLECRANDVHQDTMAVLREAGLRDVFLGVESGCDKALHRLRKHLRARTNARAIRILRDLGIHISFGFIMFDPDSTLDEVRESLDFLKENGILDAPCVTAHVLHHRARVLAGTPMCRSVCGRPSSDTNSFGGYECTYRIADPRVDLLAQCCEPVLRRVLALSSAGRQQETDSPRQAAMNTLALHFVESCVSLLERTRNGLPLADIQAMARETLERAEAIAQEAAPEPMMEKGRT